MFDEDVIAKKWMVSEEELDDEQYQVKMLKMDNYMIEGCAGSGKTILALHKAREIQELELGTYLVVIYTKTLRAFIKDGITSLGLNPDRVCNFHQLKNYGFESADYIIVDEIQDFNTEQIQNLIKMANKNFIFFGDDSQQLHAIRNGNITLEDIKKIGSIEYEKHITLNKNYRLPKPIAEFAQQISNKEKLLVERCVKQVGDKPLIIKHIDVKKELDTIYEIIESEGWTNSGILVENNELVKFIKLYYEEKGLEIEYKYNNYNGSSDDNIDFYTDTPKVMTYHSSKGLQFEHVFLPFCTISNNDYNYKDALYVAITRASESLIITYTNTLSSYITKVNGKYYDLQIKK
ncbi:3'-5' exonuclease (plasmid) [Metabacillus halosaccharovorans]|uniref:3'-5' exonuclease n=1 Tax=Metabacillus halosaccharovorans TaxID=930124 RepID=UPI00203E351D|nr:3'-5' exonuclease [Metabacillus halosaccharovorans]MCM3441561.1 TGBp1 family protein [Metabacillus halosaccharovorans]